LAARPPSDTGAAGSGAGAAGALGAAGAGAAGAAGADGTANAPRDPAGPSVKAESVADSNQASSLPAELAQATTNTRNMREPSNVMPFIDRIIVNRPPCYKELKPHRTSRECVRMLPRMT
ncbi:MAG: hypothetical protein J4N34_06015, partial [Chloroflexi bacterium]|nr:hypothetical protein [Chloroflexota bacterium]